jgi:WD40 repeat protein
MSDYEYQVGGSLANNAPSYVIRQADTKLYDALKSGKFCYVLSSRQMGKSSLLVRMRHLLQKEGFSCTCIDMTRIGSENITAQQWYKGVVTELWQGFNLYEQVNLKLWWHELRDLPVLQRLSRFLEDVLLPAIPDRQIIIFIDEIDSILSLGFPVDDFFALIRFCHNQRAHNREYNRLTWAVFGVATPSDLIASPNRTPFNIGLPINLSGFQEWETEPLVRGLVGNVHNPRGVLKEILAWTAGQPFLTQKLCYLIQMLSRKAGGVLTITPNDQAFWVEELVHTHIIKNWETQDDPEHLKTIRDRLLKNEQLAARLLGIYQQVLRTTEELEIKTQNGAGTATCLSDSALLENVVKRRAPVRADDSQEQVELLLSGLAIEEDGYLKIKNRIYQAIFDQQWVKKHLNQLRPYSQTFNAWLVSQRQDESRLLRGNALLDALSWSRGKSLSDLDYQFLAASQELDKHATEQALRAEQEASRILAKANQTLVEAQRKARKTIRRSQLGLAMGAVVTFSLLVIAILLTQRAVAHRRQIIEQEIDMLTLNSKVLFAANRQLDALRDSLKAATILRQASWLKANTKLQSRVEVELRQVIYWIREKNRLEGHEDSVFNVSFSPDGQHLATASEDHTVRLWSRDGSLLQTLTGHEDDVNSVGFSPDGQYLATASDDRTVKLWNREGIERQTLIGHSAAVQSVSFSPDGQHLATASDDHTVKLWSRDGSLVQTLIGHSAAVQSVSFSPDGQYLATASDDRTVKLWSRDGSLRQTLTGHEDDVNSVSFSPDGQHLATASDDRTVKLWNRDGSLRQTLTGHRAAVESVSFSPDDQFIATASWDKTIKIWDREGTELETYQGHEEPVRSVNFSPDGQLIVTASEDRTVKLWSRDNKELQILTRHDEAVRSISFSPDGQLIATASEDRTVKLWHHDGTLLKTLHEHDEAVNTVSFSPDGQLIATASEDRTAKLWNRDGTLLQTLQGHEDEVESISFSPDGQLIATASDDRTIKLWNRDGTLLQTLQGHEDEVESISFSPDGQLIATASEDRTVKLWSRDGTLVKTLQGHKDEVEGLSFSPDGQLIATASGDRTVKLWSRDGTLLQTLQGHEQKVEGVSFSPDGQLIVTASSDRTIKLWSRDGTLLHTLIGHKSAVRSAIFSPDGKTIASSSSSGKIILWNLYPNSDFDELIIRGCRWIRDYLQTNQSVKNIDNHKSSNGHGVCDGIEP